MWKIYQKDKRKWTCFVCGVEHETYEEFKNHIITEHEEGQDYIKCPLHRCDAPVRDVRAHFKRYHPNDKIPKNCPLKALVWRDYRTKKRHKTVKFNDGYFMSIKNNSRFFYRSGWELETYEGLEQLNEVVSFKAEAIKIPYFYKGRQRNYIPDLVVQFNDGRIEIWEIKPTNQTIFEKNKAKWAAAKVYCEARGWKFIVQTEKGMRELQFRVRKQGLQ